MYERQKIEEKRKQEPRYLLWLKRRAQLLLMFSIAFLSKFKQVDVGMFCRTIWITVLILMLMITGKSLYESVSGTLITFNHSASDFPGMMYILYSQLLEVVLPTYLVAYTHYINHINHIGIYMYQHTASQMIMLTLSLKNRSSVWLTGDNIVILWNFVRISPSFICYHCIEKAGVRLNQGRWHLSFQLVGAFWSDVDTTKFSRIASLITLTAGVFSILITSHLNSSVGWGDRTMCHCHLTIIREFSIAVNVPLST